MSLSFFLIQIANQHVSDEILHQTQQKQIFQQPLKIKVLRRILSILQEEICQKMFFGGFCQLPTPI